MELKLRELRTSKGLTQSEVAEAAGCSESAYSRYETGARQVPLDILCRLAEIYGVSADYLIGRVQSAEPPLSSYEAAIVKAAREAAPVVRENLLDMLTSMKDVQNT